MISRRAFLQGGLLLCAGAALDGFVLEPRSVGIERVAVGIPGLPPEFEGFTICQITDVHHGPSVGIEYLERVVEEANGLEPDLVALTGDYVEESSRYMAPSIKALSGLRGANGLVSILGNHDHFPGAAHARKALRDGGIPLLENGHLMIERGASALCVGGVRDLIEDRPDASETFRGVDPSVPRVLLSHHPDYAEALPPDERVDLVLSGHTHGGQVRLPFSIAPVLPSNYGQKYRGGLVRLERPGGTQVYVSRGIGVSMIPVRFNCPPEITLVRLTGGGNGRKA